MSPPSDSEHPLSLLTLTVQPPEAVTAPPPLGPEALTCHVPPRVGLVT